MSSIICWSCRLKRKENIKSNTKVKDSKRIPGKLHFLQPSFSSIEYAKCRIWKKKQWKCFSLNRYQLGISFVYFNCCRIGKMDKFKNISTQFCCSINCLNNSTAASKTNDDLFVTIIILHSNEKRVHFFYIYFIAFHCSIPIFSSVTRFVEQFVQAKSKFMILLYFFCQSMGGLRRN